MQGHNYFHSSESSCEVFCYIHSNAYLPTEFTQPIFIFHYSGTIYDSDTYTVVGRYCTGSTTPTHDSILIHIHR